MIEAGQTWECVTPTDSRLVVLTLRPKQGRSSAWVCLVLELSTASLDGGSELEGREEWFDVGRDTETFSWKRLS